jgi:hypothetical protein
LLNGIFDHLEREKWPDSVFEEGADFHDMRHFFDGFITYEYGFCKYIEISRIHHEKKLCEMSKYDVKNVYLKNFGIFHTEKNDLIKALEIKMKIQEIKIDDLNRNIQQIKYFGGKG